MAVDRQEGVIMSYRVGTTHYNLPQTESTDKRDWSDTNQAFADLDAAVYEAGSDAGLALTAAQTAQTSADGAVVDAAAAVTTANAASASASSASELATLARTEAQSAVTTAGQANTTAQAAQTTATNADTVALAAQAAVAEVNAKLAEVTITWNSTITSQVMSKCNKCGSMGLVAATLVTDLIDTGRHVIGNIPNAVAGNILIYAASAPCRGYVDASGDITIDNQTGSAIASGNQLSISGCVVFS